MDRTLSFPASPETRSLTAESLSPSETLNQWTHGFGWALSVVGAAVMLRAVCLDADFWRIVACVVYGVSLIGVYAASTLSHSFIDADVRNRYRMLDQMCIFLHIVGGFTAFALVHLRSGTWWALLALMWVYAVAGIVARSRSGARSLSIWWYLPLGWLPILALPYAWQISGPTGVGLILLGGLTYTGGTWFLSNDHRHPYFHATWHVCVIGGSLVHYCFLLRYVALWTA